MSDQYIVTVAAGLAGNTHISKAIPDGDLEALCRARYRAATQKPYRNAEPGIAATTFDAFIVATTTYDGRVASYRCSECWERGLRLKWPQTTNPR